LLQIKSLNHHVVTDKQINEMKELLRKKEIDMKAMEDRYKKYVLVTMFIPTQFNVNTE